MSLLSSMFFGVSSFPEVPSILWNPQTKGIDLCILNSILGFFPASYGFLV